MSRHWGIPVSVAPLRPILHTSLPLRGAEHRFQAGRAGGDDRLLGDVFVGEGDNPL